MFSALGFSSNPFDITTPGRLCRGRERWIEPFEAEPDDTPPDPMFRIVVSGALFTDDSADDARRGLPFSGLDVASVIAALFPRRPLLAFMEDGHPEDIPNDAEGIEAYEGYRAGGRQQLGLVRWHKRITGVAAIREIIGQDAAPDERVRGFAVLDVDAPVEGDEALVDATFTLVGLSTLDSPPARYQPAAIPDVLQHTSALILVHRDKHGPALGIYATEEIPKLGERLGRLCDQKGSLLVPFAIPPMLARWDRALSELRSEWMQTHDDEFPVPPSPNPQDRRRGRRSRREAPTPVVVAEE